MRSPMSAEQTTLVVESDSAKQRGRVSGVDVAKCPPAGGFIMSSGPSRCYRRADASICVDTFKTLLVESGSHRGRSTRS